MASEEERAERFRPIFDRIREGAVAREQQHELPVDEVRELVEAGFGALRVPQEAGGAGLDLPQIAALLVELAAADANVPQVFRGQIAFVEDRVQADDEKWLKRFVDGDFVGNAWSETGDTSSTGASTRLVNTPDGPVLRGRKFYTTGSIYAPWTDVTAADETGANPEGTTVTVIAPVQHPNLTVSDDWDGFGQQLTGTGTIVFDDVPVEADTIAPIEQRISYQTALYQLVLLTVFAGIARRAADDVADEVRARKRVYSHGLAPLARHDGQILAEVGQVEAAAFAAEAVVDRVAQAVQAVADLEGERGSEAHRKALVDAELASAQGQIVLSKLVPEAATRLFNALGASATGRSKDLDRHWRNARTVASHNPVIYKERIVGDHAVNGTEPTFLWDVGVAPETQEASAPTGEAKTAEEGARA